MKIDFLRTGGVTGMRLAVTLDTDLLPPDEADCLRCMIADARFFDQLPSRRASGSGADRFHYRITVLDGDRTKQVEVDEPSVQEEFQPLLDYLIASARKGRKAKSS